MGKRKFKPGDKIVSLDEVARQEHIYFYDKIYHQGVVLVMAVWVGRGAAPAGDAPICD